MAVFRETPYSAFNFLVEIESGQGQEVVAGFAEASGLNAEVTIAEYRAGNAAEGILRFFAGQFFILRKSCIEIRCCEAAKNSGEIELDAGVAFAIEKGADIGLVGRVGGRGILVRPEAERVVEAFEECFPR